MVIVSKIEMEIEYLFITFRADGNFCVMPFGHIALFRYIRDRKAWS